MPCRATQDGQVMVESYDKMWSTEEGNGKPLQYSCLANPMNSMKKLSLDYSFHPSLFCPQGVQSSSDIFQELG